MDRDQLRLECVKLTYSHGRNAAEAVGRAKLLEEFILTKQPQSQEKVLKPKNFRTKKKKADNPDFLS